MAQDEWRGVHLSLLVLVLLGTFSLDCVRSRRLPLATVGGRSMLHSPCGEGGLMIFMNTLRKACVLLLWFRCLGRCKSRPERKVTLKYSSAGGISGSVRL